MLALVASIYVLTARREKTWMVGTSPTMTASSALAPEWNTAKISARPVAKAASSAESACATGP
jgi:hypothetical protein